MYIKVELAGTSAASASLNGKYNSFNVGDWNIGGIVARRCSRGESQNVLFDPRFHPP